MVTNNIVKTRLILDKILDNINAGDKVGVKVHVGEALNTHYLRHDYVREVVKTIKLKGGIPTLIETQGRGIDVENIEIYEDYSICVGCRRTASIHNKIANLHGYNESLTGAPLKFIDGRNGFDEKIVKINGIQFKEVSVAEGLFKFDKLVIISRFKGHPFAGFGGALKQLGIGCVTKRFKFLSHFKNTLSVDFKKCNISQCAQECVEACPVNAIKINSENAVINSQACIGCYR